jgi:predicted Zn-dependent protease with MMP-like domain
VPFDRNATTIEPSRQRHNRASRRIDHEYEADNVTKARFEELVQEALASIPGTFRRRFDNLAIIVEDEPSAELLASMDIEPPDTLLGLYHGTPLTSRSWDYGNTLPDTISIYQRPIEDACDTDEEIVDTIAETLIHEVGHYFGMSEEEIEAIESQYWHATGSDDT